MALTPLWTRWVEELLLPLLYWQQQTARTRCPRRKTQMLQALQAIHDAFETHPITQQMAPHVLADWKAWAAERATTFQRASSAAEGRNGSLANSITISGAYRSGATRYGRCCITSIAAPQM